MYWSIMSENEYFSLPVQIIRRQLGSLRDSLVASSVWKPHFRKALETHPEFSLTMIDFAVPDCDACRLSGRLSTMCGRLDGSPYDRYTFEASSSSNDTIHAYEITDASCRQLRMKWILRTRTQMMTTIIPTIISPKKNIISVDFALHARKRSTGSHTGRFVVKYPTICGRLAIVLTLP